MVINLFFFIYSIIIIFGKGEGGRGLIFGGDIVCRIRGLTFGGGAYFRRFTVWLYLGPIYEKFALRGRFLQSTVPQNQKFSPSISYYIILHQKPNTQPSALNYKLIPCPQKIVVARLSSPGDLPFFKIFDHHHHHSFNVSVPL